MFVPPFIRDCTTSLADDPAFVSAINAWCSADHASCHGLAPVEVNILPPLYSSIDMRAPYVRSSHERRIVPDPVDPIAVDVRFASVTTTRELAAAEVR